ncbi:hypothetical protein GCM10011495_24610 [Hymenobacter frigidus]|uniref:DUF4919 domain-containing protein n=1 Tax=Hymenobacter frigidus TaxID=1524095 RepID=A0ABQ2A8L2_9BACT|nr:DUF6624 domain-containing protein [Hymenobacter frigidus]GGH86917.1 hypothetical protein GCM10011495_24610 [Hymenobacter frigidus]
MKLLLFGLLLGLLAQPVMAQTTPYLRLNQELDSIYTADQRWRMMLFDQRISRRPDSLARALGVARENLGPYIGRQMARTDSTNLGRIKALVKQYGYPGKSLVSEPANETAWLVIQHSDDIKQYLPLIKKAANKGELPFYLYGQMLDRQLMRTGKEQRYGTQAVGYNVTNPATGRREVQPPFVWPIKDAGKVNARRQQAGFRTTVEQNAAVLGIPYRVVTLKDVEKMPKQ